ncbi:IS66 family transposase [Burkholderia pseudomultivorans]
MLPVVAVTIGKYVDGTPLYRMEDVFGRADLPSGRGTLARWIIGPV